VAVVGYVVIFGILAVVTVLGLRWTRLRPGERRSTVYENPGALDPPNKVAKRIDLPTFDGDPAQSWWQD
jgi:hypothetical protein